MWILLVAAQLLLIVLADKFEPSEKCPDITYLTQDQVTTRWAGITVDKDQKVYFERENNLNLFKCTEGTLFVALLNSATLYRADRWLACSHALPIGWRYRDTKNYNVAYDISIPVGCVKPTCPHQLFDGSEYILSNHPSYTIFPTQPTLVTNGKFTVSCPAGTTFGYERTGTITLQAGSSATCEANGWMLKPSSTIFNGKFGCIKEGIPPTQPPQCPSLARFNGNEPILKSYSDYLLNAGKVGPANGQWKLICPDDSLVGYQSGADVKFVEAATLTCEIKGWTLKTPDDVTGSILPTGTTVDCFKKLSVTTTTPVPEEKPDKMTCGCWFEFSKCPTCNWQKMFVLDGFGATSERCTLGCGEGYTFEQGNVNLISCNAGDWFGSSKNEIDKPVSLVPLAAGFLSTSCVPVAARPKCEWEYGTFECDGCDKSKLISLNNGKSSAKCVLSCDIGYRLLVLDGSGIVVRAQEVVLEKDFYSVYPLGQVSNTVNVTSGCTKFTCEPATEEIEPVKLLGPKAPPAEKPANMACGCWYEFSNCPTCDWEKFFVLDGFSVYSEKCTLGCAKGYVFDKYSVNMISCTRGEWYGSSNSLTSKDGQHLHDNTGPLKISCVPSTVPAPCADKVETFNCKDCDSNKIISLKPEKSNDSCVLACDIGYRLLAKPLTGAPFDAQEVVVRKNDFLVYRLGQVNSSTPFTKSGVKFTCTPVL